MKPIKILYFVNGPSPSAEQLAEGATFANATVCYRNAQVIPAEDHCLEDCDGVAGDVPDLYAAKFPKASEAIETREAELKKLAEKVGDEAPPKKTSAPKKATVETPAPQPPQLPPAPSGAWKPNA